MRDLCYDQQYFNTGRLSRFLQYNALSSGNIGEVDHCVRTTRSYSECLWQTEWFLG